MCSWAPLLMYCTNKNDYAVRAKPALRFIGSSVWVGQLFTCINLYRRMASITYSNMKLACLITTRMMVRRGAKENKQSIYTLKNKNLCIGKCMAFE